MNKEPYKAYKDGHLHSLLYMLNKGSIHPKYIDTDGALHLEVSSVYDLDVRMDCYLDDDGLSIHYFKERDGDFALRTETLWELAIMSTCYRAGFNKARQQHEQEQYEQQQSKGKGETA